MWRNINGLKFRVFFADNETDAKQKFEQWETSTTGDWYNEMNSNNATHNITGGYKNSCEPQPNSSEVLIFVLSEYTYCKALSCFTIIQWKSQPSM